jgi:CelD/BcsL family acetyltransferase involved in cellulose biosynthesis
MPASVEWFDDLDAVAADAGGALDRARQPLLYDRLDWFRLTHRHVRPNAKLAILRVRAGDAAAWLFLIDEGHRRASPLGSWYTPRFAPVFVANGEVLLPELARAAAKRFDVIGLFPLAAALPMAGWRTFADRISTNWTLDLTGHDFASYWSARPATLRNTVVRRERSHPIIIAIDREFDPAHWVEFERVYADSWKPAEGAPAFLRALAAQEADAGALRLGIARDRADRAVAAQFWLVENGIATIHKLAHREDAKAGSPGSLLSYAMFRAAIDEDCVRRIDFGLGNEPYKADWVDTPNPVWRIDAYRAASLLGVAGIAREMAARLARHRAPR